MLHIINEQEKKILFKVLHKRILVSRCVYYVQNEFVFLLTTVLCVSEKKNV